MSAGDTYHAPDHPGACKVELIGGELDGTVYLQPEHKWAVYAVEPVGLPELANWDPETADPIQPIRHRNRTFRFTRREGGTCYFTLERDA